MQTQEQGVRARSRVRAFFTVTLNRPGASAVACVAIPVLFGLWSLLLGQDSNWDLFNYHLYNAFAFLHGKLRIDWAPAGIQTYFNPALDLVYFLLNRHLPAPIVGFLFGALHGSAFVLVLAIARVVLPALRAEDKWRLPLLVAVAGVLTANFLSCLGNTMGDDTTALFVLTSLLIVLRSWSELDRRAGRAIVLLTCAGVAAGAGVGLKLTNAPYAVALCAGLLSFPSTVGVRLRLAFVFGVGVLIGIALTGGYWFWEMWRTFRNPVFPQFSTIFPNPLSASVAVVDRSFLPKSTVQALLWPFLFALDARRVGQVALHQFIWPVLYVLFWAWGGASILGRGQRGAVDARARYLLVVVAIGYVTWMKLFSIYRYLVPMEVLAPLATFVLLSRLFRYDAARRVAAWVLGIAALVVVAGGAKTWGHEGWASTAFRADVPPMTTPDSTTVVLAGSDPAGWLATFVPPSVAFTQIGSNFPESPAYDARIRAMVRERGGPVFGVFPAKQNWRAQSVAKMNSVLDRLHLTGGQRGCGAVRWFVSRLHLHATVVMENAGEPDIAVCRLGLRSDDVVDIDAENRAAIAQARQTLQRVGLALDAASCRVYNAYAGTGVVPYQWCGLKRESDRGSDSSGAH